ncbi:phosphoglycolate phosphatase [Roseobacter sp. EG26]|uniref:phosphoglycolate phosphatase n=1 Tax=Roseobacter sp. EG26 TaxID=3412477 RepID=UPI003CE4D510
MSQTAIVFDLDGTLIHSAPDMHVAINHALERVGRPALELSQVISFIGNGVEKLVERSLDATGGCSSDVTTRTLRHFMTYYSQNTTTFTKPYDGVIDCLNRLKAAGIPMAICTNKPTGPARQICDALGIGGYFDIISGAEDGQPKKPDAAPLLRCITALGFTEKDVIYVGDSAVDYQTATNAGVAFKLFSGGYLNAPIPELPVTDRFDDWSRYELKTSR